ncbi:transferrin-binding protein-like solute binding protein [Cardiobacterium hominis]|uniref:transferrin-binding protein-like solute binding protein n=1 Tax=Cardiobacterium hominis TaxID=2718 RepID=UPI0015C4A335|nr:transferrin-binding protein-like solute binding protein [Cardiobacterium hominis]
MSGTNGGTTNDKVVTDGRFFGNRGEEISGTYGKDSSMPNEKEFIGAFGAKER